MLFLYNTLTNKKEQFIPLNKDQITMYVCGPTVYDIPHLGNARSVVTYDILYRLLKFLYPKVLYVRNITDVDDKINNVARETGKPIEEITSSITKKFHADMKALNNLEPDFEPKATENIAEMIAMIELLIKNNNAYISDDHVIFSVDSYDDYGKLSGRKIEELIAGSRVEVAGYKKNPADFVLWKPSDKDTVGWDSPWGRGRPGWHIECSVMSSKFLGNNFDIHGGGADLKFPHHENEIAQSKCANKDSHFARYWVHNGFLTVNGEKMSKSLGNFTTVRELLEHGISGDVIRFILLSTHYRKPVDFNDKALSDAKLSIEKFSKIINDNISLVKEIYNNKNRKIPINLFIEELKDDLNVPLAISHIHSLRKEIAKNPTKELINDFVNSIEFLAILDIGDLINKSSQEEYNDIPKDIIELANQRKLAKENKDFAEADKIRAKILENGYVIEDLSGGKFLIKKI